MLPLSHIKSFSSRFWLTGDIFLLWFVTTSPTLAQIVPDATLPVNSTVTPSGNTNIIEGGTTAGGNLFHSFREFSIPTGAEAFFNNAVDIQNIFTRVTGGNISNIDGLISLQGSANLFLLNPNGIVFGSNARLDLRGSFLASTASSFKFANGVEFSATNPQAPPLLTINVPIGLQFGVNPGAIATKVDLNEDPVILDVDRGGTLALIGGDLRLQGDSTLEAPGGRIELGSVGDNSFVSLTPTPGGFALGYEGVVNFRDIQLLGLETGVSVRTVSNGGGNIQVQSRRLTLERGSVIEAGTEGAGSGGTVTVRATESIDLSGTSPEGFLITGIGATTSGTGNAGNVRIETGRLTIRDGAAIGTGTQSAGKAGNVSINATQSVELRGTSSLIFAGSTDDATGDAGNVTIDTGQLIVRDGAAIRDRSGVFAGSLLGGGNGGTIAINAQRLIVQNGGSVGVGTASTPTRYRVWQTQPMCK